MKILQTIFVRCYARYTSSRHAEDIEAFAQWLLESDYSRNCVRARLCDAAHVLDHCDRPAGGVWTFEQLNRVFRPFRRFIKYQHARHTFGVFLRSKGRLAPPEDETPHAAVLAGYRDFLSEVRGLAPETIYGKIAELRAFLRHATSEAKPLEHLTASTVDQYMALRTPRMSRRSLRSIIIHLNGFLSYCFDHHLIRTPLKVIDQPVCLRYELPPRALPWPLIEQFLSSVDRTDRNGWRDFMLLHLMAHYGLRPGEITRLTLNSIQWQNRSLLVEQSKTRSWLTLPLSDETLALLQDYLKEGRRHKSRTELFTSALAPWRPLTNCNLVQIFRNRAIKSGLPITHATPYALRHSFAMRLFARGVGIKVIGDLMGHGSIVSTSIYLRLQTDALREVALAVPAEEVCHE